jgi:hypothetical protein
MNVRTLTFAFISLSLLSVIADEAQFECGSVAVARDPTGSVLGTDSTRSLEQLLEFARVQDQEGVQELAREGHLFSIKSGSSIVILMLDLGVHAYKVRVIGSNQEIFLVKETVFKK